VYSYRRPPQASSAPEAGSDDGNLSNLNPSIKHEATHSNLHTVGTTGRLEFDRLKDGSTVSRQDKSEDLWATTYLMRLFNAFPHAVVTRETSQSRTVQVQVQRAQMSHGPLR